MRAACARLRGHVACRIAPHRIAAHLGTKESPRRDEASCPADEHSQTAELPRYPRHESLVSQSLYETSRAGLCWQNWCAIPNLKTWRSAFTRVLPTSGAPFFRSRRRRTASGGILANSIIPMGVASSWLIGSIQIASSVILRTRFVRGSSKEKSSLSS